MNSRRVGILLIAALVVVAAAVWLAGSQNSGGAAAGGAVLPELKPVLNDVTEVRISKADGTRTTLRRDESGWVVAEREFPADSGRARKLLLDLSALEVVEEKTREPGNYKQLGVQDITPQKSGDTSPSSNDTDAASSGVVSTLLEAVTPAKTFGLIVGKQSGARSVYVRPADSPQSLLVTPVISAEADPTRWIDRNIVDIPPERVREVAVKPASGPAYTVTRENREQTNFTVPEVPKGRELSSPSAANPLASGLVSLTLDDVRRPADEEKPSPRDQVTFRTFDGLELELTGRKDGDSRYVAVAARSTAAETAAEAQRIESRFRGWELEIPGYKYDSLFRPLEELLAEKPDRKS